MKIIRPKMLQEFRKVRCELCPKSGKTEPHHYHAKGMGNSSQMDIRINLIGTCNKCHKSIHDGNISRNVVLQTIADREKADPNDVQSAIYFIARLDKWTSKERIDEILDNGLEHDVANLARAALEEAGIL